MLFKVALMLFPLLYFSLSLAVDLRCGSPGDISIVSSQPTDSAEICAGAEKAIAFLGQFELRPRRPIRIEIVDRPIDENVYVAFGNYDAISDRIRLMSYAAIFSTLKNPQMYGEPFDRVHYSGVIAHEVAHAVIQDYIRDQRYSMAPQEYLAHATQLAVMPEERRKTIIKAMDVEPWQGGDSISHIYMALNPGKFAVKSYLHLMSLANQTAFVQILLNNNWFYVYVPKSG